MRKIAVGLGALLAVALGGPALGESVGDEIQGEEQPGSEFELEDSSGKVEFGRESTLDAESEAQAEAETESDSAPMALDDDVPLDPLDDPDNPDEPDPTDEELPGEGPESLSGPDDEDPLPY
jgi:hypothetical protein